MQNAEVELKFSVTDTAALEQQLPALGFTLQTPRTFEHNVLYDTADRSLRDRHQILRLRQYGDQCVVTHKRPPANADDTLYKTRIETETTVRDNAALATIFTELGLRPVFTYEKFRSEWAAPLPDSGHLVIDETPIGAWAELEGPTEWIDRMLIALAIDRTACSTDSYGTLFLKWKQRTGSPAENLSFDEIAATLPFRANANKKAPEAVVRPGAIPPTL